MLKGTILGGILDFGLILVNFRLDRDSKKCLQILIESFFRQMTWVTHSLGPYLFNEMSD